MQDHLVEKHLARVFHAQGHHGKAVTDEDDIDSGRIGHMRAREIMGRDGDDGLLRLVERSQAVQGNLSASPIQWRTQRGMGAVSQTRTVDRMIRCRHLSWGTPSTTRSDPRQPGQRRMRSYSHIFPYLPSPLPQSEPAAMFSALSPGTKSSVLNRNWSGSISRGAGEVPSESIFGPLSRVGAAYLCVCTAVRLLVTIDRPPSCREDPSPECGWG